MSKWWGIGHVSHRFVESDVTCDLNLVCLRVKIVSMTERSFVSKENARAYMDVNFGITFMAGKGIDATAKDQKEGNIGTLVLADFVRRFLARAMRDHIVDHKIIAKGIRPEFRREIGQEEHGVNSVGNGTMRAFHCTVFKGGGRAGNLHLIARTLKKVVDFGAVAEFTALIKTDPTVGNIWGVSRNELLNKIKRRTLITTDGTTERTTVPAGNENVACFTIETRKTLEVLDGLFSFAGGCFRVDGRNLKRAIATSLNLGVKIENKILRRSKSSFSDEVPVRVTKEILPGSILDDFGWTVFKSSSIRNPRRCVG